MSTKHDIVLKQQSYYKSEPFINSTKVNLRKSGYLKKVQLINDVKIVIVLQKWQDILHNNILTIN